MYCVLLVNDTIYQICRKTQFKLPYITRIVLNFCVMQMHFKTGWERGRIHIKNQLPIFWSKF
jgi:hypothetical protein